MRKECVDILVIAELERDSCLVEVEGRPAAWSLVNAIRVKARTPSQEHESTEQTEIATIKS